MDYPEVDKALRELLGPKLEAFNGAFLHVGHVDIRSSTEQARATKRSIADGILDAIEGPWARKCCSCELEYAIQAPVNAGDNGAAWFKISVERPTDDVRKIMDPQAWSCCDPENFDSSYLTNPTSCSKSGAHPACTASNPTVGGSLPTHGTAWGCRVLYENFHMTFVTGTPSSDLRNRNLLQFQASTPDASSYLLDYGLCQSIDSTVDGNPCTKGGIDMDCGFSVTSDTGGPGTSTTVSGTKYLHFLDPGLDAWLDPGFRQMIDQTAYEYVCCGSTSMPDTCPKCLDTVVAPKVPDAPFCTQQTQQQSCP